MKQKVYSGEEFKKMLIEKAGVPDGIYNTAILMYNGIIYYLSNMPNETIHDPLTFKISGDYIISDFIFNITTIEIIIDYSLLYDKRLGFDSAGNVSFNDLDHKFMLKTADYSPENNKTIFIFNYDRNYSVKVQHVLKYFKNNKDTTINNLTHELKHKFDEIKKPLNPLVKAADYKSYDYVSGIPSIDFMMYGMYYTSQKEMLVKNSEFYSMLRNDNVTKKEFNNYLINTQNYKTLSYLRNLTLDKVIDDIKKNFMNQVSNIVGEIGANMTDDEKIYEILKLVYVGITNLKLDYINSKLKKASNVIFNSLKANEDFYNNEVKKINNTECKDFFSKKLKDVNIKADEAIKKLSTLYDTLKEERGFWVTTVLGGKRDKNYVVK